MGLYIHFPFCVKKCGYCSFTSIVYKPALAQRYTGAVIKEITARAGELSAPPGTVYFGGGTPSLMSPEAVRETLDHISRLSGIRPDAEISMEVNPGTASRDTLLYLRQSGINRLSIGVQSLSDTDLRTLGRIHSADESRRVITACREAGFDNIGVDLIYGLPGQTMDGWLDNLTGVLLFAPEHISIYCLSIDKGTLFERVYKNSSRLPSEDLQTEMYLKAVELLTSAGYEHYEISNFALYDKKCRHNLLYWNRDEYLGIGAGAHSFSNNTRIANTSGVLEYIEKTEAGLSAPGLEILTPDVLLSDAVIFGLRKIEGIDLQETGRRYNVDIMQTFAPAIDRLIQDDLLSISAGKMRLTPRGILFADLAALEFLS